MIWPGQLVINLYCEESFWGCPLYDVVAKAKSLDRASKCWFALHDHCFTFFWVWYHRICRTIPVVQLEHHLVSLLANPSFLRYSILLCRLHTNKFPHSVVILGDRLWRRRITRSEDQQLPHSVSYNVCIGVRSVDSDELSSFCKVVP